MSYIKEALLELEEEALEEPDEFDMDIVMWFINLEDV